MYYKLKKICLLFILGIFVSLGGGCSKKVEPLIVYSGKGMKNAMDEIVKAFEKKEGTPVNITYAGSNSLLLTLNTTRKGDVFMPGSYTYIKKAGDMVIKPKFVAHHIPAFIVSNKASESIKSYEDLLKPGVRLAVGNKDTCAIGRVGEAILSGASSEQTFRSNVVVTGSTVNELFDMVQDFEVDAALVWEDMVQWDKSGDLTLINLPENMNKTKEIWVASLSSSNVPEMAARFSDFVTTEGQAIFIKHGFRVK